MHTNSNEILFLKILYYGKCLNEDLNFIYNYLYRNRKGGRKVARRNHKIDSNSLGKNTNLQINYIEGM